ncbi:DNA cytosine methyltransferase [uncultured Tateyamaria sp.]|uniref:DNA cytosine methyltransferase n=1 Tax=uncultured Tateyamaria sp. TaxID=455651 RepID=UPI0026398D1D|nr:DNA cytosine methyltransferase [uncultured Tateyamaria sp.]
MDGENNLRRVLSDTPTTQLQAVDLFCGAGGFSLAALAAGFHVAFAVENDKYAIDTYRENFNKKRQLGTTLYHHSINDLQPIGLVRKHFPEFGCDIVLGGPPCQGFSTHRINGAGVDDPRNKLILSYFKFVEALRPRAFLMENVPGILWPRHEKFLDEFNSRAQRAGYKVFPPAVLDARDFGVPQRRKRVFVLGIRTDISASALSWPPKPSHSNFEDGLSPWVNCKGAFQVAPDQDPNDIHMKHGRELVEAFRRTPPNGGSRKDSGRTLPCHEKHDGHKDVYGRIDPDLPGPTMTTACINPSKGRFVHPTEHHGITVRQAARMQTFPDDFVFLGGLTAAGCQIGNAVPVDLGAALLKPIAEWLGGLNAADDRPFVPQTILESEV